VRIVLYLVAALVGVIGFIFLAGSQGYIPRLIVGIVLIAAGIVIVYLARAQPRHIETTNVQKIDLSGDVNLEEIRCRSCNAPLSKDEIEVRAGAIFVQCDHCGATYQIEEEPKW
jgi:hypothetical protein